MGEEEIKKEIVELKAKMDGIGSAFVGLSENLRQTAQAQAEMLPKILTMLMNNPQVQAAKEETEKMGQYIKNIYENITTLSENMEKVYEKLLTIENRIK